MLTLTDNETIRQGMILKKNLKLKKKLDNGYGTEE